MKEITINNWDELQQTIFDGVWEPDIMRYRSDFVYHGIGSKEFDLIPKLNRFCSHNLELEAPINRNFEKYAYAELQGYHSFWQVLACAEHHGLPTRLLDWTYSPLVAAHFATDEIDKYDTDGSIWCVNFSRLHEFLPAFMKEIIKNSHSTCFTIDMLDQCCTNLDELKAIAPEPFVLFFEPASMIDRIVNQYALFSIVSDPKVSLASLLPDDPEICYRIIIPKEVKLEIRDKLDYINISERLIYPGLDGICKWITRRYANLGPYYNNRK